MRKPHEKTIDGAEYIMYEMNPFKASALMSRILKMIGKPVASIIQGVDKKPGQTIMEADFNQEMIGTAVEELVKQLNEKDLIKLMKDILPLELITFKSEDMEEFKKIPNIESHFGKFKLIHLYKVLKFGLEVNFEDFFSSLAELKD